MENYVIGSNVEIWFLRPCRHLGEFCKCGLDWISYPVRAVCRLEPGSVSLPPPHWAFRMKAYFVIAFDSQRTRVVIIDAFVVPGDSKHLSECLKQQEQQEEVHICCLSKVYRTIPLYILCCMWSFGYTNTNRNSWKLIKTFLSKHVAYVRSHKSSESLRCFLLLQFSL
jgi:hypothetical protein